MSNAPRVTPEELNDNIVDVEILKHTTKSGQILRWAILTTKNGFAVVGKPSCAVSVENDNKTIGESIALENSKEELWPLMGYALKERLTLNLTPPVTARLKIWEAVILQEGARVHGAIYDDSRKKFADGAIVTTSPILHMSEDPSTITTKSGTVYQIERVSHDEWVGMQLED